MTASATRAALVVVAAVLVGVATDDVPAAIPAYSSVSTASTSVAAQTLTIPRPAAAGAGQVLVATIAVRLDSPTAISAPSGWVDVVRTTCTSGSNPLTQAVFVRVASAAEPDSYTFSMSALAGAVGSIVAYTGVDVAQPVNASAGRVTRTSRSIVAPSITTTVPGALLVGAFAGSGRSAITVPAGMTLRADTTTGSSAPSARMIAADQLQPAAGASGTRTARAAQQNTCNVGQFVALRPAPDPPLNTSAPVVSGEARSGAPVSTTTGSWSDAPTSYAHQWQRAAVGLAWIDIAGATAASYLLTDADVGFTIRAVVTASNQAGLASTPSTPTAAVLAAPPVNQSPPTITGATVEQGTLVAEPEAWTGSSASYSFAWERCDASGAGCGSIEGARGQSYVLTGADVELTVRVVVTASNGGGSATAVSAPSARVEPAAAPASVVPPAISGVAQEGNTLNADPGTWSGSPTAFAWEWQRCAETGIDCVAVGGFIDSAYPLTLADVGFAIRVLVTASNSLGSTTAAAPVTAPVLPAAPQSTSPPAITGDASEGGLLTTTSGEWSGSPTLHVFRWERCDSSGQSCSAVVDAASASYSLTAADVGYRLRVVVTASNAVGSGSGSSDPTAVVVGLAPANLVAPSITGIAREGEVLTASAGTWAGSPTQYAYQWQRSADGGLTWAEIPAALAASYVPVAADVGVILRVSVTASNAGGSASATSAPTTAVEPGVPPTSLSPPTISGVAQDGGSLAATTGTWSGAPTGYAYQWQRSTDAGLTWTDVTGALASVYFLTAVDVSSSVRVVVTAINAFGSTAVTSGSGDIYPAGNLVVLLNRSWSCASTVDIDLVKVTLPDRSDNAIYLRNGCSGRIGRIEIDTWHQDGVKVHNGSSDLVIGGGLIACHARDDLTHQDGVQVQGGARVTFSDLTVDCRTANNAAFFVSGINGATPTDVVCERCTFLPGTSTVSLSRSLRAGVRDSRICRALGGSGLTFRKQAEAIEPVDVGNTILPGSDPVCLGLAP
jgi:hypothetical protein